MTFSGATTEPEPVAATGRPESVGMALKVDVEVEAASMVLTREDVDETTAGAAGGLVIVVADGVDKGVSQKRGVF